MLVSYKDGIVNSQDCRTFLFGDLRFYLKGILFIPGYKEGEESMRVLYEMIKNHKVEYLKVYGSYALAVMHSENSIELFTDNSHMRCLFIGKKGISTDFLELIRFEESKELDFDAVSEYFAVVRSVNTDTVVKGISLSNSSSIYIIKDCKMEIEDKKIGDLSGNSTITDPQKFFESVAYALKDKKCIAALTGGFDSRLVAACMKQFIDIDTFISGSTEEHIDVAVSKKVAEAGKLPWKKLIYKESETDEKELKTLFQICDGRFDNATPDGKRIQQFYRELEDEGYEIILTGEAGDMHKEFWYMQDFPFYNSKKTNVKSFYNKRCEIIPGKKYLTETASDAYARVREQILKTMELQKKAINTQSYDKYGYDFVWNKSAMHNQYLHTITLYNPLQELDIVRYSYHLSRNKRFFNNSLRAITTKADHEMARVKTNYGTTSSSELVYVLRDVYYQSLVYFRKARKLLRKRLNRIAIADDEFFTSLRQLPMAKEAVDFCKSEDFIRSDLTEENLPKAMLSKAIYIYLLHNAMLQS